MSEPRVQDGIASVFDRASGYYRDLRWDRNRLTRFERELTRRTLAEELGPLRGGFALEIGCGPGTWTPLLAERSSSVLAIDLSEKMLAQARATVHDEGVEFRQADAATFVTDRTFDMVMSVRALEYVPEWALIIGRLGAMTRRGGRLVVVTKTPVSVWRGTGRERWFGPHTMARRLTGRRLDPDFWQRHIPVHSMCTELSRAGFVDIKVRPVIVGLPIFMRGTKQYPIVPRFAERPVLGAAESLWRLADRRGPILRRLALVLSESYAVSATRC